MQTVIPTSSAALRSLLRADFTAQWRNRRSVILVILVPSIILYSWKGLVPQFGGAFVLSNCITVGLTAVGLMGYANSISRDRDKGIFQRLRVSPAPAWCIMASRLLIQLAMIIIITLTVFVIGYYADGILISKNGYIVAMAAAIFGGALYLSIGQMIVGLIKSPETVNAVSRLVYFLFIMIGMLGEFPMFPPEVRNIIKWSPYGAVRHILAGGLQPDFWDRTTSMYLLVTIGYTIVFAGIGIKKFKWNTK